MKTKLPIPSGTLRPTLSGDAGNILGLLQEKNVRRFLCDDKVLTRAEVADIVTEGERLDAKGMGYWVIEHAQKGFAGIVGLTPVSAEASVSPKMTNGVEPTIAVLPDMCGRGLASEAMDAIIDYARSTLGLSRLVAAVDKPNTRSHRLMLRSGFSQKGTAPGPAHLLVLYECDLQSLSSEP
ncbi:GNAT family N-acetyltransferase [Hoeflea prorocentri]|uniref:GNAT family N-acetyltransferase n=1 Tax=Hoeflea prorocentri TaxID=1922333 RepID=A0A9X3UIT6_9HYPH|nr:GNAT family N-acetyltransferase [Hoeflea prorocentri]MCY6381386.1 GNAT family N-acetyltransferase [Hoeflea prorocentri]MDA5399186.1 GNAT family N-acetyltransferase [Hoeflea prorocentri]